MEKNNNALEQSKQFTEKLDQYNTQIKSLNEAFYATEAHKKYKEESEKLEEENKKLFEKQKNLNEILAKSQAYKEHQNKLMNLKKPDLNKKMLQTIQKELYQQLAVVSSFLEPLKADEQNGEEQKKPEKVN